MSDIYEAIVYDDDNAYMSVLVKATARGNAIRKAREKIKKRMSQIPKDRDRARIVMNVRKLPGLFEGTTVNVFDKLRE